MRMYLLFCLVCCSIAGCANPLNQATSTRYLEQCYEAERNGQLSIAEEACYRALVNVDWGNLGEAQKGDRLYDLGRIKRQIGKYDEAEQLFKQSLDIENNQENPSNKKRGRRIAELAILYGQQNNFDKGVAYVEKLLPISDVFSGNEYKTVAGILYIYSEELKNSNSELANLFLDKSLQMGFDPKATDR